MLASKYLFVYGTLMSASHNPIARYLKENAKLLGVGRWPGELFLIKHYPGAIKSEKQNAWVYGEVFELRDPVVLDTLDRYEECTDEFSKPHEYIRQLETIFLDSQPLSSWMYIYNHATNDLKPIHSGRFINAAE
jgi:gamma-glutamylcyclotransferase (GGCT)/AIG2-like uncharacterized protein YtfP